VAASENQLARNRRLASAKLTTFPNDRPNLKFNTRRIRKYHRELCDARVASLGSGLWSPDPEQQTLRD